MIASSNASHLKLSILTPTIPARAKQVSRLNEKILEQIDAQQAWPDVEHLILSDNCVRSIGAKRQALVDIARGKYIAFVDDDDDISDDYIEGLLWAADKDADVITFEQLAIYNGIKSRVVFRMGQDDGPFRPDGITHRGPWHVCAWKREIVAGCQFLETNYGEDRVWAMQARRRIRTEKHIEKILHLYTHDADLTAAPEIG